MTAKVESGSDTAARPEFKLSKKKQALFLVIIFVIFLLILEGLLRLLGIPVDADELKNTGGLVQRTTNSINYEYAANWSGYHAGARVTTNSMGWRGKEFSVQKPAGVFRILGVGDSFTFGRAVDDDDIFLAKLEQMLNSSGGQRYETINAGHENVNTVKELRYFKEKEMMKLDPDVVVLGFTVHNDAQDVKNRAMFRRYKRRASLPLRIKESQWFNDLSDALHLARVVRSGVEWAYKDELTQVYQDIVLSNYADGAKSWDRCKEALLGFYEICRERNTPFVFVLFPVYTKDVTQTYREYPEEFRQVHEKLKAVFAGKPGAIVVDMLDDLAATGLTIHEMRVPADGHPNKVWHEIVARRLQQTIAGIPAQPTAADSAAIH